MSIETPVIILKPALLLAEASRRTGLSDFGDAWFLEPFEVLVTSMREEANLSPLSLEAYEGFNNHCAQLAAEWDGAERSPIVP